MTQVFFINAAANLVILIGLGALSLILRGTRRSGTGLLNSRLLRTAYWSFLIGASIEIAIAAVLFARSLDRNASNVEPWTASQYLVAACVGLLVGAALRRLGDPADTPESVVKVRQRMTAVAGDERRDLNG